jgi:hypothetical protein
MKRSAWILLGIAVVVVLFLSSREGFEATATIKKIEPQDHASRMAVFNRLPADLKVKMRDLLQPGMQPGAPGPPVEALAFLACDHINPFFNKVYKLATSPIKVADIDAYMNTQPTNVGPPGAGKGIMEIQKAVLVLYFIETSAPVTGGGATGSNNSGEGSGNTTGGGSVNFAGNNSGGSKGGLSVFGPETSGMGEDATGTGASGKPRNYPVLFGPKDPGSRYIEGVGVAPPSKSTTLSLSGLLPGDASLGVSRQPGDQDLIPDPYRVSQSYSTSSYSSKTEPVPFLSDFSKFMK